MNSKKLILLVGMVAFVVVISMIRRPSESHITNIHEQNQYVLINANYPTTDIPKLDKQINVYIQNQLKDFKQTYETGAIINHQSELNIDYQYEYTNKRYISITIKTFINSPTLAHPYNEVKTFVYDTKRQQLVNLKQLFETSSLKAIIPFLKEEAHDKYSDIIVSDLLEEQLQLNTSLEHSLFAFSGTDLIIYYNPYEVSSTNTIIELAVPLTQLDFTIVEIEEPIIASVNQEIRIIDPTKPVVALTFDDGPSKYTIQILEILTEYDVPATFFVLGNKVRIYKEVLSELLKQGSEIGNHSYNHKWLARQTEEEIVFQINETQYIITETLGYTPTLLRPTYGSLNDKIRDNTDLTIVLWTIDTQDWKLNNSTWITNRVLKKVSDTDIILMHDTRAVTVKALKEMIPKLQEMGYQLVTISELEQVKQYRDQMDFNK